MVNGTASIGTGAQGILRMNYDWQPGFLLAAFLNKLPVNISGVSHRVTTFKVECDASEDGGVNVGGSCQVHFEKI